MRQVTKEEYDVLKRFGIRCEVRYYASAKEGRKGTATRKQATPKTKPRRKLKPNKSHMSPNALVRLSTTDPQFRLGTKMAKAYAITKAVLGNDPTRVARRQIIAAKIKERTGWTGISWMVTLMIDRGALVVQGPQSQ